MQILNHDEAMARLEAILENLADALEDGARFLTEDDAMWLVQEVSCLCQEALFDRYEVRPYRVFGAVAES